LFGSSITSNGYEIGKVSSSSFASNSLVETGTGTPNQIRAWGPVVTFYTTLKAKSLISYQWLNGLLTLPEGFRPFGLPFCGSAAAEGGPCAQQPAA
jgi:hypothetical protein